MSADFLQLSNSEAVLISSITSITADPHVQNITFRSDGKDFAVRIAGIPSTLELGFMILDAAESSLLRVASIEDILDTLKRRIKH